MQYDDDWEDHFFAELGSSQAVSDSLVQEDPDDEGQFDLEPPPPKITRFQDAISSLEEVQSFLDRRGFSEEATRIASSVNKLTYLHCERLNLTRQTTLDDFILYTLYKMFIMLIHVLKLHGVNKGNHIKIPEMWPPLYKGQRVVPQWWPL